MKIKIKKLNAEAVVPKYATPGSSGFDLVAIEDVSIPSGETKLVKTGLAISVGEGYELQVRPRSGLSLKTYLRVANSPGTVDSDFIGEVCVIITNTEDVSRAAQAINIKKGDRIAQGVVCPVVQVEFDVVEELTATVRGAGGYGSTGK
jgi:dUTP diphosphatase